VFLVTFVAPTKLVCSTFMRIRCPVEIVDPLGDPLDCSSASESIATQISECVASLEPTDIESIVQKINVTSDDSFTSIKHGSYSMSCSRSICDCLTSQCPTSATRVP
jgi:hypothetical protein